MDTYTVSMFVCLTEKCRYTLLESENLSWLSNVVDSGNALFYCKKHYIFHICPGGIRTQTCVLNQHNVCMYTEREKTASSLSENGDDDDDDIILLRETRDETSLQEERIMWKLFKNDNIQGGDQHIEHFILTQYSPYAFHTNMTNYLLKHKDKVKGGEETIHSAVVMSCIYRLYTWFIVNLRKDAQKQKLNEKVQREFDERFTTLCLILLEHISKQSVSHQDLNQRIGTNRDKDASFRKSAAKLISYDLTGGECVEPLWREPPYAKKLKIKLNMMYERAKQSSKSSRKINEQI